MADSEDEHDLDAHVLSEDCDHYLACCHRGRNFQTNADLMVHRKQEHEEKVKPCRHFSGGGCVSDNGWFSHTKSNSDKTLTSFKCNYVEHVLDKRYKFMNHRKLEHGQILNTAKRPAVGHVGLGQENAGF